MIVDVIPPGIEREAMIGHAQDSLERARDMLAIAGIVMVSQAVLLAFTSAY